MKRACGDQERRGFARCLTIVRTDKVNPLVAGYGPSQLQAAYRLPSSTNGSGQVVAIVDAFDNPDVASNLATYRSNFGLPAANFTKYNQLGQQGNYPAGNTGWGVEIDARRRDGLGILPQLHDLPHRGELQ